MSIYKPETVADAVKITTEINEAIKEYYEVIDTTDKILISERSLCTLKRAAELYLETLGGMKVK